MTAKRHNHIRLTPVWDAMMDDCSIMPANMHVTPVGRSEPVQSRSSTFSRPLQIDWVPF